MFLPLGRREAGTLTGELSNCCGADGPASGSPDFARASLTLIAFVDNNLLPELGVPSAVAAAVPFGATVNSDSYRSLGAEVELEAKFSRDFRLKRGVHLHRRRGNAVVCQQRPGAGL